MDYDTWLTSEDDRGLCHDCGYITRLFREGICRDCWNKNYADAHEGEDREDD